MDFNTDFFGPLTTQLLGAVEVILPLAIPILVAVVGINWGVRWVRGTIGG